MSSPALWAPGVEGYTGSWQWGQGVWGTPQHWGAARMGDLRPCEKSATHTHRQGLAPRGDHQGPWRGIHAAPPAGLAAPAPSRSARRARQTQDLCRGTAGRRQAGQFVSSCPQHFASDNPPAGAPSFPPSRTAFPYCRLALSGCFGPSPQLLPLSPLTACLLPALGTPPKPWGLGARLPAFLPCFHLEVVPKIPSPRQAGGQAVAPPGSPGDCT